MPPAKPDAGHGGKLVHRTDMKGMLHKASKVLMHLTKNGAESSAAYNDKVGDRKIPATLLRSARGLAFITVVKIGFLVNTAGGTGIVIAKDKDGNWSGPVAVGVGGLGFGFSFGASSTDVVMVLCTDFAVKAMTGKTQVEIGGSLQVAAGPYGRQLEGGIAVGERGLAPAYSYSYSRGLFVGATMDGTVIMRRSDANTHFYGTEVDPLDVLSGDVKPPPNSDLARIREYLAEMTSGSIFGDDKAAAVEGNIGGASKAAATASSGFDESGGSMVDDMDAVNPWEEVKDAEGSYWWNTETNETTGRGLPCPWERPKKWVAGSAKKSAPAVRPPPLPTPAASTVAAAVPTHDPWQKVDAEGGGCYWWNTETNETTPVGAPKPAQSMPAVPAGGADAAVAAAKTLQSVGGGKTVLTNVGGHDVTADDAVKGAQFYSENKQQCDQAAKFAYDNKDTIAKYGGTAMKYGGQAANLLGK